MATREENLKKINDKLEQLSNEQLAKVSAGTWHQTADDAHFLHALNPDFEEVTEAQIVLLPGNLFENEVKEEWKRYGVTLEWHGGAIYDNKYYINGREVSRDAAFAHAREVAWG